jgi:RNA polymerase sigma-70 factor (ECF subfamily)
MNAQVSNPAADEFQQELLGLIARIVARDDGALGRLYDLTVDRVYGVAMRVLGSAHDADEVVCDVFHQVWVRARQYAADRGGVLRWLLVIAYTRAIDARRRRSDRDKTEPLHPDEGEIAYPDQGARPVDDLLDAVVSGHAIHRALATLSGEQRKLVSMAFLGGATHQEISARTGIPLGTVKSHIRRGLLKLRTVLEELGYSE